MAVHKLPSNDYFCLKTKENTRRFFDIGRVLQSRELNALALPKEGGFTGSGTGLVWYRNPRTKVKIGNTTITLSPNIVTDIVSNIPSSYTLVDNWLQHAKDYGYSDVIINNTRIRVPLANIAAPASVPVGAASFSLYLALFGDDLKGLTVTQVQQKIEDGEFYTRDTVTTSLDGGYTGKNVNYPGAYELRAFVSIAGSAINTKDVDGTTNVTINYTTATLIGTWSFTTTLAGTTKTSGYVTIDGVVAEESNNNESRVHCNLAANGTTGVSLTSSVLRLMDSDRLSITSTGTTVTGPEGKGVLYGEDRYRDCGWNELEGIGTIFVQFGIATDEDIEAMFED